MNPQINKNKVIHKCDWCDNHANVYIEKTKKDKKQNVIPTGIKWYACSNKECRRKTEGIFKEKYRTGLRPVV